MLQSNQALISQEIEMSLILTPLEKALTALSEALAAEKTSLNRDATIQRFEYSFELTWKLLKRYLSENASLKEGSIKNVFRESAKLGLLNHVENWFEYLQARNLTSHTYNEKTAEATYEAAKKFLPDAMQLLAILKENNDTDPTH